MAKVRNGCAAVCCCSNRVVDSRGCYEYVSPMMEKRERKPQTEAGEWKMTSEEGLCVMNDCLEEVTTRLVLVENSG